MTEEDIKERMREWADNFETEEEFVAEIPSTLQGVLDILLETASDKEFLTPAVFRQIVMFLSYTNCNLASEVLGLNKEEYIRMCEISYDAFINLTATHDTSDRRDH